MSHLAHDHGWHLFDAERGLEVQRIGDAYELRRSDAPDFVVPLTAEQWDAYRAGGDVRGVALDRLG